MSTVVRPWWTEGRIQVAAATSLVALADLVLTGPGPSTLIGLLSAAALLLGPRYPWLLTLSTSLLWAACAALPSLGAAIVAALLVLTQLVRARLAPQAALHATLYVAAGALYTARATSLAGGSFVKTLVLVLTPAAVMAGAGLGLRQADRLLDRAREAHAEAHAFQRTLIARELHDTVARATTHMVLQAEQLRSTTTLDADSMRALDDIIVTGRQSMLDLRSMLRVLREDAGLPTALVTDVDEDLTSHLDSLTDSLRRMGLTVTSTVTGDVDRLGRSTVVSLVHILDECAANMSKYASREAEASIQLEVSREHVGLLTVNSVAEASRRHRGTEASSGLGLMAVRERAAALGGEVRVTQTGGRWMLQVVLPLDASHETLPHGSSRAPLP